MSTRKMIKITRNLRIPCVRFMSSDKMTDDRPFFEKIKSKFVDVKDLDKRPSDLEIREKDLPYNTPTLGQRLKRDARHKFWISDKHGGYHLGPTGTWRDYVDPEATVGDFMKEGFQYFKEETVKFKQELYDDLTEKNIQIVKPGDERMMWNFFEDSTTNEDIHKDFIVSSDSSWGEGYSFGDIEASPSLNSLLFYGDLNTRPPNDGRTKYAGYVSMKSVTKRKSFSRVQHLPFEDYDALILKVRGDGRTYFCNILLDEFTDMLWHDVYQFPLYTRGGPYWQDVEIPFSRFYLTYHGKLQDKQYRFDQRSVENISFVINDRINGPFHLEIAQIGLRLRTSQAMRQEKTAYETYRTPHGLFLQN